MSSTRYGPLVHRSVHHAAILWIVGIVVFLIGMVVTQLAWTNPSYSLTQNYISDLGAVNCGYFPSGSTHYVCSPWHDVFNASIIVMGLFLILGVLLIPTAFPARGSRRVGLALLVLAGIGAIGVGLSPEDVNRTAHYLSAFLAFAAANFALIVLGLAMFRDTRWDGYRAYTFLSGIVGLVALGLFGANAWTWGGFWGDWGVGGIERTIVAPVLLWAIVVAVHLLRIPSFAPPSLSRTTTR
jgi:hypothetical membrane protein